MAKNKTDRIVKIKIPQIGIYPLITRILGGMFFLLFTFGILEEISKRHQEFIQQGNQPNIFVYLFGYFGYFFLINNIFHIFY